MRIVLMGQAAFGARTLEALLDKGKEVIAVYTPAERPGGRSDPLKEAAAVAKIPVFQPSTYKKDDVFDQYKELRPDLTILAFVTEIIPARFFQTATHGAICYHPSLLPRHRGASAINWAIIMGDTRTGLTILWPDGGIDTGPILLQKVVDIGPDDTTGSLYFSHLFPMGIDAILESVDLIEAGKAPSRKQDEKGTTYEPPCSDEFAAVDWLKPARGVYNLVRGCDPQPGAYAYFGGEKVRFFGARVHDESVESLPGTIMGVDDGGIHVALSGGRLTVSQVRGSTGGKLSGLDWAVRVGLKTGDRFGGAQG
jgi:methionyl-tRNA formyltransferase